MKNKVIYVKVDEEMKLEVERLAKDDIRSEGNVSDYIRYLLKREIKENPVS